VTTPAIGTASPPDRPARPDRPELLDPRDVPRRRPGSAKGRRAILHAVAHIELNAVDLHWDVIARFSHVPMPIGFFDDWVRAADEESKHFNLVADVLDVMDCPYGTLARPCRHVARRRGHRGRPDGAAGRGADGAGGARPRRDARDDRGLPQGHDRPRGRRRRRSRPSRRWR
jgi:hypothetical protein